MSAAMASNTENKTVYVRLLDEGTDVMRPAEGIEVSQNIFHLMKPADYNPEFESWEFAPGSLVRCEEQKVGDEILLVVVEKIDQVLER